MTAKSHLNEGEKFRNTFLKSQTRVQTNRTFSENIQSKTRNINEIFSNSYSANLPYIVIQNPPLKLLIDTGNMSSMLSPNIVERYFPENIYNDPTLIITAIGKKQTEHKVKIRAFKEFNSNINLNFIVFQLNQ